MRKWKLILLIIVLMIALPVGGFSLYEWWTCRPIEKAFDARLSAVRRQVDALPVGATRQQIEELFGRNQWPVQSIPEDGKPALVGQEIVPKCGSWVCDDEVVIRVTIMLDGEEHVAAKSVRV